MDSVSTLTRPDLRQSVGIDIANESFEASLGKEVPGSGPELQKSESFDNTETGFASMITSIRVRGVDPQACIFVMEATGVYYEALAYWLYDQGYSVAVLLPNTVLCFAKSWNVKTKSDQIDARTLAHMGCERHLDLWEPAPKQLKALKQLTRYREKLVHQRTMAKNQHHASKKESPLNEQVIEYQRELIEFFTQQIKQVEKQIQNLIKADKALKQSYQYLLSIPAIGHTTAATLMAETQNFRLFRNQAQLVSYAGYDVIKKQSGSSINHLERISKKGNHRIRKALFFPSIIVPKYIPAFERLYQRINQKNAKTKMKGAVALQRKLLVLAYQLVKNKQYYDPSKGL